jgi:hypothetical protein
MPKQRAELYAARLGPDKGDKSHEEIEVGVRRWNEENQDN